jgi:hypothetical protein
MTALRAYEGACGAQDTDARPPPHRPRSGRHSEQSERHRERSEHHCSAIAEPHCERSEHHCEAIAEHHHDCPLIAVISVRIWPLMKRRLAS